MAVIFLLGPSMWDPAKRPVPDPAPMQIRREISKILTKAGHKAVLMEDDPDRPGEDYIQKFDRLLRHKITDVVLYWPPLAKMQTTYDELILLYDRQRYLHQAGIEIWALHHSSVASIQGDEFKILEIGSRSRYLTALVRLGIHPLEWAGEKDLTEQARLLSTELLK